MAALFGIWDLRGTNAAACIEEAGPRAALRQLDGPRRDWSRGPLWLTAAARNLETAEGRCAAWEGLLLRGGKPLEPGFESEWTGHFALAWADPTARRLRLTRDASAGERLFYAEEDGLVLFSSSVRPLLMSMGRGRRVHRGAALEQLLQGLIVFGDQTLFEGIREVAPGHFVEFAGERRLSGPAWPGLIAPEPGSSLATPVALRAALKVATASAIGKAPEVLVSLSGGIDSAATAALAVELLGPERVSAVTYTFDDPAHVDETPLASLVCRHLGIVRHHVARISYDDFIAAVPEAAWRMEDVTILSRTRLVCLSRAIRALGFDQAITGHGIEQVLGMFSHGRELADLASVIPWLPSADAALSHWPRALRPEGRGRRDWRERLHRGLKPPPPALFQFVVTVLFHNGLLREPEALFPEALRPHVAACLRSPGAAEAVAAVRGLPIAVQFQRLNYDRLILNRFFKGKTRFTREAGATQVSPAMFLHRSAVAGHYWTKAQPDRSLLRAAMGELPAEILDRPKICQQAVNPESWSRRLAGLLRERLSGSTRDLAEELGVNATGGPLATDLVDFSAHGDMVPYARGNLEALALWRRIFIAAPPPDEAPDWSALL